MRRYVLIVPGLAIALLVGLRDRPPVGAHGVGTVPGVSQHSDPRSTTLFPLQNTSPSRRLQPPDALTPAAGICAHAEGSVATLRIHVDVPSPRCSVVMPRQRLRVVNALNVPVRIRLAYINARLGPREARTIGRPFGAYLAPGVHIVAISAYAGGGAELWLRRP